LDWRPLVRTVVRDVERGRPAAAIAAAFHAALADGIAMIADRFPDAPTVLGGGVFQNGRLVELTAARFAARGRWLGTPGWIPVNDGGLAAGQLAVALAVEATGLLGSK
jgi:hydrogenase maturation protein HypF